MGAGAVDDDGTVTQVQFFRGTTSLGVVSNAPYNVTWSNAVAGVYALTARAKDNHGLMSTSAVVSVIIDPPSKVALTSPSANAVFVSGSNIGLTATATNTGSPIAQVQFFAGPNSLGVATSAPYSVVWSNAVAGVYALTASATDGNGLSTTSAVASIIVDDPPVVTLTAPTNGAVFPAGSSVSMGAGAVDDDGTVTQVQFFRGTTSLGVVSNAPYNVTWSNAVAGVYALTARAKDNHGLMRMSAVVSVIIDPPSKVALTSPSANAVFVSGSNIGLTATATNTGSPIAQVQFFAGPNSLGVATSAPYSVVWSNAVAGVYALTASATDGNGLSTTSAVVSIIVDDPPVVTLTAPTNGAVFPAGSSVSMGASAVDDDGTVTQVQFFRGTTSLGVVSNAPYNVTWSNAAAGVYALTARAKDNHGLISTSAVVSVIIDNPPKVTLTKPSNNTVVVGSQTNITLTATASDAGGTVMQVQFFKGTNSLGLVANSPYSLVWSNATTGNYALTAVAVDNNGLTTTSSVVNLIVTPLFATNNLSLWLKGSAITGLSNNAPIGKWADSSGRKNNAVQTNAINQPGYLTNALNGYPAIILPSGPGLIRTT